jgi:hypothetical protein
VQVLDHVEDGLADEHVDAAGGLVGDQQRRLEHEAAGQGHALALTRAEFPGLLEHGAERQVHAVDERRDDAPGLGAVELPVAQVDGFGDGLADGQVGAQAFTVVLCQVADHGRQPVAPSARELADVLAEDACGAADQTRAPLVDASRAGQPGQGHRERRLA